MSLLRIRNSSLTVEELETRALLSTGVISFAQPLDLATAESPLTPTQIRRAYGFDQVAFNVGKGSVAGDGTGTTIAIVDAYFDRGISNDLHIFDSTFALPDPRMTQVYATAGANSGWELETALDVEWAHAIAPKANILLVEARSDGLGDLLAAVNYARSQPGVVAVSMSWGSSEWSSESNYDSYFTTPAGHAGVTFVASSGDQGAPPSWPAVSANVLSVGGTSLTVNSSGTYLSETAWSHSGGGSSAYVAEPVYQQPLDKITGRKRGNPDVAYDADPNSGVRVYDSGNGGWFAVGGTSAGAPQWAGLVAIADQGRSLAGQPALSGNSQALYALYSMAQANYTRYFHDITAGGNNGYAPGYHYDLVTGLGSPVANQVIQGLVGWAGSGVMGSLGTSLLQSSVTTQHPALWEFGRLLLDTSGESRLLEPSRDHPAFGQGAASLGWVETPDSKMATPLPLLASPAPVMPGDGANISDDVTVNGIDEVVALLLPGCAPFK